jgi:hypothetical protein
MLLFQDQLFTEVCKETKKHFAWEEDIEAQS